MKYKKLIILAIVVLVAIFAVSRLVLKFKSGQGHDHSEQSSNGHSEQSSNEHSEHSSNAHEDHGNVSGVQLSEEDIKKFGIKIDKACEGEFDVTISVPGEIVINTDYLVHIVPRVPGIVKRVFKKLDDPVKKGEVMAVIESRNLADAKSAYLASIERFALAKSTFEREEKLWKDKISPEQDYLDMKKSFAEAKIEMRNTKHKLRALGFSRRYLEKLPSESEEFLTTFKITAPFKGNVIEKNITLGEVVRDDTDVFVVANLDTVWVDLLVHQKDVALIKKGQKVTISAKLSIPVTEGLIDYVDPVTDKETRTALVRVSLDNSDRKFRPGTFITAHINVEKIKAEVVVSKNVLQNVDDKTCVFVKNEHGFDPRPVTLGRSDDEFVEIVMGLEPGEIIATENSFRIKAQLEKDAGGGQTGHGHAH